MLILVKESDRRNHTVLWFPMHLHVISSFNFRKFHTFMKSVNWHCDCKCSAFYWWLDVDWDRLRKSQQQAKEMKDWHLWYNFFKHGMTFASKFFECTTYCNLHHQQHWRGRFQLQWWKRFNCKFWFRTLCLPTSFFFLHWFSWQIECAGFTAHTSSCIFPA